MRAIMIAALFASNAAAFETRVVPITSDGPFADYRKVVVSYAKHELPRAGQVEYCIVAEKDDAGNDLAWVLLPGLQQAVLWEPGEGDLRLSRRILDLKEDVATGEDLSGSTYRVTKAWLASLRADCRNSGRTEKASLR